jgi:hypothetical protein
MTMDVWLIILAFIAGTIFGVFVIGLISANGDDEK